jgi:hypothetical protein
MKADQFEDHLDLLDPKIRSDIAASERDRKAGRTRPAAALLAELRGKLAGNPRSARKT